MKPFYLYLCITIKKHKKMTILEFKKVKEGDKITFVFRDGKTYTRKVQGIRICRWNEEQNSFLVNRIGSGTGYINIDFQDVLFTK